MTNRTLILFGLIFALFLFGLATLSAAPLAMALPLLLYLALGLVQRPEPLELTAERSFGHERARPNEPITVRLFVTNTGAQPRILAIEDTLPAGMRVIDGDHNALTTLAPGETRTLEYTVQAPRGEYKFRAVHIAASDPFDLAVRHEQLDAPGMLTIEPDLQPLRTIAIRPPRTRGFAGPIAARQAGSGVDFFFLREYQPGDRQRAINWRASARAIARAQARADQTVFTNLFEQERIADVGLILDARQQSELHSQRGSLFERSVQATAALADTFLSNGNRVSLLIYGGGIASVFPGYGRGHRMRIFAALGRATPGHHFVFETLRNLPTRMFTPQSQIVFVGPLPGEDVDTLVRMRARGYAVMVVSPNPVRFATQPGEVSSRSDALALRAATAERALHLQQLRRQGITTVDWDVDEPLDTVLRSALRPSALQARGNIGGVA
ncbi:MAG: DUF58 domain-containing protein [Chloroflexi bacterium]|nr:DUF58 domain-containing protein [Chloroflexota bacterium]